MKTSLIYLLLLISVKILAQNPEQKYSWETQQAKVLPNGDLEWAPRPFQLVTHVTQNKIHHIKYKGMY